MYRDPDKMRELRRRRDETELEKEHLEEDVEKLRAELGMGTEHWRLRPTARRTAPFILLGLGAWSLLDGWFGFGALLKQLLKALFGH